MRPRSARKGVTRLAVFGSTVRNEARPDSDVDVLVDIDWRRKFSLFDWAGLELLLRDLPRQNPPILMETLNEHAHSVAVRD